MALIHQEAYDKFKDCVAQARRDGSIVYGGGVLTEGDFAKGYFAEPTILEGLPEDHPLVKNELFVPILHLTKVSSSSGKGIGALYTLALYMHEQSRTIID
ncbi:MAG: aldehyde dehydrogenase family protein [Anaerolineae bacterium]